MRLAYNSGQMERDALLDTTQTVHYETGLSFSRWETQKRLQKTILTIMSGVFSPR